MAVLIDQFAKRYSPFLTQTLKSLLELNPERRTRSKQLYESLMKFEQQILDLEPFEIQTSSGYNNQYQVNSYYNQPYQPYSNIPHNPQPIQGYSYSNMSGAMGNAPGNPQYMPNVRWNDNTTVSSNYKRPWLIWRFCFIISFIFILFYFTSSFTIKKINFTKNNKNKLTDKDRRDWFLVVFINNSNKNFKIEVLKKLSHKNS